MKLCLIEFGNANSTIVMSRKKENDCHADETKKAHPTTKKGNWKTKVVGTMTPLSDTFAPGPFDVICSRGKTAKNHPGNQYYVSVIQEYSERYANTEGKLGKSLIVSEIIDTIRRNSPAGGFVRKDGEKWFEVGDWTAREKVRCMIRSTKARFVTTSMTFASLLDFVRRLTLKKLFDFTCLLSCVLL